MVLKIYSKCCIELSCIWSIKFFIFWKRYNLFLCSMNSLSGISHLFLDISVLIFPLLTPTVDYHQLQPLSVNQGLEKTRKAKKKTTRKLMFFILTLVQWTKISLAYSIPHQTFKILPRSLNLGNHSPPPPLAILKGSMVYTILHNANYLKYSWSQLTSFSISHLLCAHTETATI